MARQRRRQKGTGSVYKRGSRWYYENQPAGLKRSLKSSDHAIALERAKEWFGYLELQSDQKQQEALLQRYEATKKKLEDSKKAQLPLSDVLTEYEKVLVLASKKGSRHVEATKQLPLSENTLRITKSIVLTFLEWLAVHHPDVATMDMITARIAQKYFIEFRSGKRKASSFNRHLADLRVVWRRLNIQAGIASNPFDRIQSIKKSDVDHETDSKRPFSIEELATMQQMADGWIRPGMFIGYYTALRLSDVVCLRWQDIDGEGYIRVQTRKASKVQRLYAPEVLPHLDAWREYVDRTDWQNTRKLSKGTAVAPSTVLSVLQAANAPCPTSCASFDAYARELSQFAIDTGKTAPGFRKYLDSEPATEPPAESAYVFPRLAAAYLGIGRKRDTTLATKEFQRFLTAICEFNTRNDSGHTVLGFHSLRTSHATYARNAGIDLSDIQHQLGHSNGQTTNGYIQQSAEDIRRELKASHRPLLMPGATEGADTIEAKRQRLIAYATQATETELDYLVNAMQEANERTRR